TDAQPFRSTFTTFKPVVLTDNPPTQTTSYRVATAGDLAITVQPSTTGSTLSVYDLANPETPTVLGNKFVPFFATAYDIAEAVEESDTITVDTPYTEVTKWWPRCCLTQCKIPSAPSIFGSIASMIRRLQS